MLYIAIFLISAVLFILLFIVKINASVEYIRNAKEEWIKIAFYTEKNLLRYEYEVPLLKKEGNKIKFKLVKGQGREMREGTSENSRLTPDDIIKKFFNVRVYFKDHADIIKDIRRYLIKRNIHVSLNIELRHGTGDAAQTGLLCGLLWSAAGIVAAWLSRHVKISENDIKIIPCFDKKIFEVRASCIFNVRLVHIIVVLKKIYLMKYSMKMKAKMKSKAKKTIGGEVSA